uniref:Uncharacterized protein n=1 Tax=Rhipicephalus microplus TaxID=6941 RepID=A0A6G5AHQ7_RHIMP
MKGEERTHCRPTKDSRRLFERSWQKSLLLHRMKHRQHLIMGTPHQQHRTVLFTTCAAILSTLTSSIRGVLTVYVISSPKMRSARRHFSLWRGNLSTGASNCHHGSSSVCFEASKPKFRMSCKRTGSAQRHFGASSTLLRTATLLVWAVLFTRSPLRQSFFTPT